MSFKSPENIKNMFNEIAEKYDFINNIISFGSHKFIKKLSVNLLNLKKDVKVLDLCTGTGDIAQFIKLKEHSAEIIGADFSENMLNLAKKKNKFDVEYIQADCTNLPFEDSSFDVVTISFGLRNIENSDKVLDEISRVLKKDGQFLHLDFGKSFKLIDFLFDFFIPPLVKLFYNNSAYDYLIKSKKEFAHPDVLIKRFEAKGFKFLKKKNYLLGIISAQLMRKL